MTYEFEIVARLPGMNEFIEANRRNPHAGAQMKRNMQALCSGHIRRQLRGVKITRPVILHYIWYEKDRRRDHDNVSGFGHKVIQDALVECGVLKNDGWKEIVGYTDTFAVDSQNPKIIVMIEEVDHG